MLMSQGNAWLFHYTKTGETYLSSDARNNVLIELNEEDKTTDE